MHNGASAVIRSVAVKLKSKFQGVRPGREKMDKIELKIEKLKKLQAELDNRQKIEAETAKLMEKGKVREALQLINTIDDKKAIELLTQYLAEQGVNNYGWNNSRLLKK